MNFWSNMFTFAPMESNIVKMLKQDPIPLEQILLEEDFIIELRNDDKVSDYIFSESTVKKLFEIATCEFSSETSADENILMQKTVFEIFEDVSLNDFKKVIAQNSNLISYLIDIVQGDIKYKIGFACKLLGCLLDLEDSVVLSKIYNSESFVEGMCSDLESYDVFEFILKLFKMQSQTYPKIIEWICRNGKFVQTMLKTIISIREDIEVNTMIYQNIINFMLEIEQWRLEDLESPVVEFFSYLNDSEELYEMLDLIFCEENMIVKPPGCGEDEEEEEGEEQNEEEEEEQEDVFTTLPHVYTETVFKFFAILLRNSTVATYSEKDFLKGSYEAINRYLPQIENYIDVFIEDPSKTTVNNVCGLINCLTEVFNCGYKLMYEKVLENTEYLISNYFIDLFFLEHPSSILKRDLTDCFRVIMEQNYSAELKDKLLSSGENLSYFIDYDKSALEEKEEKNLGPEYWSFSTEFMIFLKDKMVKRTYYEENDEIKPLIIENDYESYYDDFINYLDDVVIPREMEQSEYFTGIYQ